MLLTTYSVPNFNIFAAGDMRVLSSMISPSSGSALVDALL